MSQNLVSKIKINNLCNDFFNHSSIKILSWGGKRIYFGASFLTRHTIIYSYPGFMVSLFFPHPLKGLFKV